MSTFQNLRKALTEECPLHGSQKNPAALGYSSNSVGYSLYSPACNGCAKGKEDRKNGLWMSGFLEKKTDSVNEKDNTSKETK